MSNSTIISVICNSCGKKYEVTVNLQDFVDWEKGVGPKRFAQNAFPYLSPSERELLISHTCSKCFDEMFGEED